MVVMMSRIRGMVAMLTVFMVIARAQRCCCDFDGGDDAHGREEEDGSHCDGDCVEDEDDSW